jgi:hypothetical protein
MIFDDIISLTFWAFIFYLIGNIFIGILNNKDIQKKLTTPLDGSDSAIARIQFLSEGNILNMKNEEEIIMFLKEITPSEINKIIKDNQNLILKEKQFVIPYLFIEYKVTPKEETLKKLKEIMRKETKKHEIFQYFYKNIEKIFDGKADALPKNFTEEAFIGNNKYEKFKYFGVLFMFLLVYVVLYLTLGGN